MIYKALFFDLDDTLWDFTKNAKEALIEAYDKMHYDRYFDSFDQFYSVYSKRNAALWVDYRKGLIDKDELNSTRFNYPLESVGVFNEELSKEFAAIMFAAVSTKSALLPGAREVLDALSKKYPLYIVSNGFKELQFSKMSSANISGYFKEVILSDIVGALKPSEKIFNFALKSAAVSPCEALMIGDDWAADIVGAKNVGIDQVFLGKLPEDAAFTPTYHINSIVEVLAYL